MLILQHMTQQHVYGETTAVEVFVVIASFVIFLTKYMFETVAAVVPRHHSEQSYVWI